ncbi:unnamed protein product [Vicia faba]|uniref:Uncharacterized protein n=1 Tax=Vicia faba TaxID=3906 RepID=A0AAV0ZD91_VICFA|nr:unnamed protein product [Vicia faba]
MEKEYEDLKEMMKDTGLYEMDNIGDYYTWSNKHVDGVIYSRIGRALANVDWLQMYTTINLHIIPPRISVHALLCLEPLNQVTHRRKHNFKFLNKVIDVDGYAAVVEGNWKKPLNGSSMVRIWKKLLRLQPLIKKLSKPLTSINNTLKKSRQDLLEAQNKLMQDKMNKNLILAVK